MTTVPPKVFISYSHDTVAHQARVLDLADRLRADGIDAEIDQYNDSPSEGWPRWCERQIEAADFVLVVCTETYHRRVRGEEKPGTGRGVVWEARIIRQLLYDASAISDKFVPVLFSDASPEQIPTPIKGWSYYVVDTEEGYEGLYRRLTGQPHLPRPALGTIRTLPARKRQRSEGTIEALSSPAPAPPPALDHDAGGREGGLGRTLWGFLKQENNRQVLGWLGGGGVALAGGIWALVTFFYSPDTARQPSNVNVEAPGGVNISGTIGSVGGDIVGGNKITYGSTAEEIVTALEAKGVFRTAETAGLERQTIIKIAQRLKPNELLDFDQAVRDLESAVNVALDVIARGERGANQDDFVNAVLARVAEETRRGNFDSGAGLVDEGLAKLDAAHRSDRITLLEEGVKVDILRRDAFAVARRIETLVTVNQPTERPAWLPAFRERYDTFYEDGEVKGINFSLSIAIELARRMVATAHDSTERGTAAILLGNALFRLGERESGTQRLEEAVEAYRAALEEYTRERVPLQWAATQNNLGNALKALGERESGTQRLEEAVEAYRAALEEQPREQVPLDWAMTQNNLGTALKALGKRESGTVRLEEAVSAYRDALKEYTRERVPRDWAMTQNNLGNALKALGERESGTARLEEAVDACREALKERTREQVPLDWATTQNNLGTALATLGERESGTQRLEEAVEAYRAALEEWTLEQVPLQWAGAQNNLGNALATLGARESGTARLEEAVDAYREALKERTREQVPLDWATTQNNLGAALQTLGARESGTARLEEAVEAFREALKERTRERAPLDWATTQTNLGNALQTLGARESGTARLEEAVDAYREALKERTREQVPLDWATTQTNLGNALKALGARTGDRAKFAEARKVIEAAFDVFMQAGQEHYRGYFEDRLGEIDRQIAELNPPR